MIFASGKFALSSSAIPTRQAEYQSSDPLSEHPVIAVNNEATSITLLTRFIIPPRPLILS
jgi:hypothetical protein